MAANNTEFNEFIAGEVNKYQGRIVPVKAGLPERMFEWNISCSKLHPNPYDEFCYPDVGPNYEIISGYGHRIKEARAHGDPPWDDPILVEKMLPDGYLILNGHHRWAAALRFGLPKVRVRIVNLTHETDIKKMIELSDHNRRVSFDLDEVILTTKDAGLEHERISPLVGGFIRERIRPGVPALIHYLARKGYDIWVYSSQYYSMEYIRRLFKGYHIPVNGIITGTARPGADRDSKAGEIVKKMEERYTETLHIDGSGIVRVFPGSSGFEQYDVSGEGVDWSREVMNIIEKVGRQ